MVYSGNNSGSRLVLCCEPVGLHDPDSDGTPRGTFDAVVGPHLNAAFNYARWLTRNDADAEDVAQDAAIRAFRYFGSLRNDNPRAWLLTIVRHTWYARAAQRAARPRLVE